MKRTPILGLILAAMLFSAGTVHAQTRVAAISAAKLVTGSPQFKSAEEAMRKEFEARGKQLEGDVKKLAADIEKFKRDADILSASERARIEKELNTRRIDTGYAEQSFKEDLARRRQELFNKVLADISVVIEAVAQEGKYDLVVQDPVYATDAIDITDTVIQRLQKGK